MPSGSRIVLRTAAEADVPTPDTDQTALFMNADDSNAPAYKDDGGIVHALAGAAGSPGADAPALTYTDHGDTGSTESVDFSVADVQRLVANAATVTITYTGLPAAGTPGLCQLWLEQDVTGGRVWAFPAATDWGDPGEPDWSTRSGGAVDLVSLETVDGGTRVVATLAGRAGPAGGDGANGADGDFGGAIAIDYVFSTTTTDSDPGSGNLRLSNATQASAVTIRADLNDSHGVDWSAVLATLADSTNTVKGHIRLVKRGDLTKWLIYTVSAIASPSGYKNITVANVSASGVNPLGNGDAIVLLFTRAGDVGASGTASVGTDPIWDAKGDLAAGTGADAASKLTVGSNDLALVAASGQTTGLKWGRPVGTILAAICYGNSSDTKTTVSTSMVDADATNLAVTFTAPASGNVLVRLTAVGSGDVGGAAGGQVGDIYYWGLRESSSDIAGPSIVTRLPVAGSTSSLYASYSIAYKITGLTPGNSYTYKWSHKVSNARCTGAVVTQAASPATMEVISL